MRGIALGCFWFSDQNDSSSDFSEVITSQEFLNKVKLHLENIDNISNVDLDGYKFKVPKGALDDEEAQILDNSRLDWASVDFDIYLPRRLQEEYGNAVKAAGRTLEQFHVRIKYEYHAPILIIDVGEVPDTPETISNTSPSNAVASVRNYLKEKLRASGGIRLNFVGPSPFHANIFIRGGAKVGAPEEIDATDYAGATPT